MSSLATLIVAEQLDDLLEDVVARLRASTDPLAKQTVVVPNNMVSQWLEQQLASRLGATDAHRDGVVANLDVIFPAGLIGRALYGEAGRVNAWTREQLSVRLLATRDAVSDLSLTDATRRASDLFDVATHRPEELDAYLASGERARERQVVEGLRAEGLAPPHEALRAYQPSAAVMPDGRLTVLGCDDLSSGLVLPQLVAALAPHGDVAVFLTTPDALEAQAALEGDAKDSLLQRWNTLGHAHLRCWVNTLGAPVTWRVGSSSTARTNLVTKLRAASGGPADDLAPLPSLEVHGAVGYARQVEVARDALLHAVRELGVRPHEIRVVTTDVQRFAPLMSALWSPRHATGGRPYLQFETADPRLPRSSDRLRAFRQFLRTVDSHFTMLDVVALLNEPALQLGLGLHRNDVERLSSLAANYGVSMGLTAESRAALDVFEANDDAGTWERFADRGLLSSVFERSALGETHPIQPLGVPDDVAVFAEVARLVETLRDAVALLGAPQPLSAWLAAASTWSELLGRRDDVVDNALERVLSQLSSIATTSDAPVTFVELRELVERLGDDVGGGSVFGRGGVSVVDFHALRNARYRVTCVLGLDEELLPSPESAPAHLGAPRPSDPSGRDRFRASLLATLLSTSDKVLLFTNDRNVRDGGAVPLALPLAELSDALATNVAGEPSWTPTWRRHPRHAFSTHIGAGEAGLHVTPDVVDDASSPFSLDPAAAALATKLREKRTASADDDLALRAGSLPQTTFAAELEIRELASFVKTPQAVFLRTVLRGASVPEAGNEVPIVPRLSLGNALDRWTFRNRLVRDALASGGDVVETFHPDDPLATVATGLRPFAEGELGVPSLAQFVRFFRRDLERLGVERVAVSQGPSRLSLGDVTLSRGAVDLYRFGEDEQCLVSWTTSGGFSSLVADALFAMAYVTVETGRATTSVMLRPCPTLEPVVLPFMTLSFTGDDPVAAARAVLEVGSSLYFAQGDDVPLHFYRTSLAGAVPDLFPKRPADYWNVNTFQPGTYESERPENRLLFPFEFKELRELRNGAFVAQSQKVSSLFANVAVDTNEKQMLRDWVVTLSPSVPTLESE